jgi:hypothetical protein
MAITKLPFIITEKTMEDINNRKIVNEVFIRKLADKVNKKTYSCDIPRHFASQIDLTIAICLYCPLNDYCGSGEGKEKARNMIAFEMAKKLDPQMEFDFER